MAVRRPLVRGSGRNQQLPVGDVITGLPLGLKVHQSNGSAVALALDPFYLLPVMTAAGATVKVGLTSG
jgi:hypothetical protein